MCGKKALIDIADEICLELLLESTSFKLERSIQAQIATRCNVTLI